MTTIYVQLAWCVCSVLERTHLLNAPNTCIRFGQRYMSILSLIYVIMYVHYTWVCTKSWKFEKCNNYSSKVSVMLFLECPFWKGLDFQPYEMFHLHNKCKPQLYKYLKIASCHYICLFFVACLKVVSIEIYLSNYTVQVDMSNSWIYMRVSHVFLEG